jgi:hydrocephalus-inducing protein
LEHKSEIPFDYDWEVLHDTTFAPREFTVLPNIDCIQKFSKEIITLEFVPMTIKQYDVKLVLHIQKVGQKLSTIAVMANCLSPTVSLKGGVVDFGHIFVGREYKHTLMLQAESDFPAKFEFALPEPNALSQAEIAVSKQNGIIALR